ncbi:MAG TPA: DedA family protein [Chloroflexota bacterium]|nr:DedA family protein [Chloroflexota bacterium]
MLELSTHTLLDLLATYGYWAVFLLIAVESMGIPLPGETMLIAASIYAGNSGLLHPVALIAAAATGAILGDNLGYLVGREGGYRLLRRYGHLIRVDERRLKLGRYLFLRHGGAVVFFGRFVAVLRMWAAFLAGTHRMPWRQFLFYNAAGGAVWATAYGIGGFALGSSLLRHGGWLGAASMVLALVVTFVVPIVLRRHERRLSADAERAFPGPLDTEPSVRARGERQTALRCHTGPLQA